MHGNVPKFQNSSKKTRNVKKYSLGENFLKTLQYNIKNEESKSSIVNIFFAIQFTFQPFIVIFTLQYYAMNFFD